MRTFFLFYLISRLTGNPLMALLVLAVIYLLVDRRFIGLLPDFSRPFRRVARLRQLRTTIELNPANASALLELGTLLFEAGRAREALPYLEKAAAKLDDHASAQYTLGAALVTTGQYTEGATALRRAVKLRPEVQYGMPYVYLVQAAQHWHQDTEDWVDIVSRYGNVETCYRMGVVLAQNGQRDAAVRMWQEALSNYRQSPAFARKTSRRWAFLARWCLMKK